MAGFFKSPIIIALGLSAGLLTARAPAFSAQSSCSVPLSETKSAPSVDLLQNGLPIDRDLLMDQIKQGLDTSTLEPQLSKVYRGTEQSLIQLAPIPFPESTDSVRFASELPGVDGLVRARVESLTNPNLFYQLNFSLDTHAALVRNALLRKLGYAIPTPKYLPKLTVQFQSLTERDSFLDTLASDTLTSRGRWVVGGADEVKKNLLSLTFQDVVLEPAVIEVPQFHWGILTPETLNSRRSLRALLIPLTLLDITESVNMYSYEVAKIFNESITFSRANADKFKNETTIGDARWIARKIAKLSRGDWMSILRAGHYPTDIEALLIEKTLGRVNQLMGLLGVEEFKRIPYNPYLTYGNILKGKALQEKYEGYALRFTYGDPKSPLHASELLRFFGIASINGALGALLDQGNSYLQAITPDKYIAAHSERFLQSILDHFQNHPNEPFVQPLEIWGGPTAGGNLSASRNIVTGTYYGSESKIQLVDSISASLSLGGFFGVSGIPKVGVALSPNILFSRNYVHVRPLSNIKAAWKDNWSNLFVPKFMFHLSNVLAGKQEESTNDTIKAFMDALTPGELFIITDGFSGGGRASAQIPLGAMLGFLPSFGSLSSTASLGGSYGILSRTTLIRTKDGIQVYLSRINSKMFEVDLNAQFLIRLVDTGVSLQGGNAHTKAFILPEKFEDETKAKSFKSAFRALLRRNNPEILEEEFSPYQLNHHANGSRAHLSIGPFSWVKRLNFHRLEITPPLEEGSTLHPEDFKRTVIDGQLTRITGTDLYGFFSGLLKTIHPLLSLGGSAKGDDPSSNFLGSSRTLSVNSQIEITPSRENHPFLKIQQSYSGWSMRKNRLLRLVRKIADQLDEFNPGSGLINPSEFSQTKKIQSYNITWSLLVYEAGINRVLELLNLKTTDTLIAHQTMIQMMGQQNYFDYCSQNSLSPSVTKGPRAMDDEDDSSLSESSQGQTLTLGCVTPWMRSLYSMRSRLAKHPEVFAKKVQSELSAKEKLSALNRTFSTLERDVEISSLMRLIGKENSFFQVRISGFRTKDENGDSEYFSNTIGEIDREVLAGPLSDIESSSQISSNEIEARYLSNGY